MTVRIRTTYCFIAIIAGGTVLAAAGPALAEPGAQPREVYEWTSQLAGDWVLADAERQEGGTKAHPLMEGMFGSDRVAMSFKLVGRGSTVQEDLLPGTERQMVTMYHCKDSDCSAVKATHYCAKRNQPEFLASASSSPRELIFECDMSTELCQSWDAHIHRITHQLSEDGTRLRSVYANYLNGEHTRDTVFHFERIAR